MKALNREIVRNMREKLDNKFSKQMKQQVFKSLRCMKFENVRKTIKDRLDDHINDNE